MKIHISPTAIEAGARAACDAQFWPGMWETIDPESNEAKVYRKIARATFTAMVEAWPGMQNDNYVIVLPLPLETDNAED